jgi:homoserine O-succinyltransferase
MPLIIPDDLPTAALDAYAIRHLPARLATRQDIRPLRILLLNLMPQVLETETQVLRLLANTPLQVEITLVRNLTSLANHPGNDQLLDHYRDFRQVRDAEYDAVIVIGQEGHEEGGQHGSPPWDQIAEFLDWTRTHVRSSLYIGWAARAAVSHFHELLPWFLPERQVALVSARVVRPEHPLVAGVDHRLHVPVARAIRYDASILQLHPELEALVTSEAFGVHLLLHPAARRTYLFDHLEASAGMFRRDIRRHLHASSSQRLPLTPATWRSQVHLLLANWLDVEVYQPLSLVSLDTSPRSTAQERPRSANGRNASTTQPSLQH